jgi:hypothetical protein
VPLRGGVPGRDPRRSSSVARSARSSAVNGGYLARADDAGKGARCFQFALLIRYLFAPDGRASHEPEPAPRRSVQLATTSVRRWNPGDLHRGTGRSHPGRDYDRRFEIAQKNPVGWWTIAERRRPPPGPMSSVLRPANSRGSNSVRSMSARTSPVGTASAPVGVDGGHDRKVRKFVRTRHRPRRIPAKGGSASPRSVAAGRGRWIAPRLNLR